MRRRIIFNLSIRFFPVMCVTIVRANISAPGFRMMHEQTVSSQCLPLKRCLSEAERGKLLMFGFKRLIFVLKITMQRYVGEYTAII